MGHFEHLIEQKLKKLEGVLLDRKVSEMTQNLKSSDGTDLTTKENLDMATKTINDVLKERGDRYGSYGDHARFTQGVKALMRNMPSWNKLTAAMKETLEMNAHKTGCILGGDPTYKDSWTAIIGYTKLVEDTLDE